MSTLSHSYRAQSRTPTQFSSKAHRRPDQSLRTGCGREKPYNQTDTGLAVSDNFPYMVRMVQECILSTIS